MFFLKKFHDRIFSPSSSTVKEEEILNSFPINKLLEFYGQDGFNPGCLFLGDSVVERVSDYDMDTRSIDQLLSDKIGETHAIGCLSYSAYNTGVFYLLIRAIQTFNKNPSVVIFPINMRSFSPQWDRYPPFQCTSHIDIIKKYIYMQGDKINYPLYGIDKKGDEEKFYKTKVKYPCINFSRVRQFTDIAWNKKKYRNDKPFRYKILFIFHYLYSLEIKHRKLMLMKDLIGLLLDIGIKPLIYITPINYKAGIKYVGEEFISYHRKNVDTVRRSLGQLENKISFNDYSILFNPDLFFHENETTEHLNEKGRLKLASLVFNEYQKLAA